jgi:uncharacterized protein (TIGR03435 family)
MNKLSLGVAVSAALLLAIVHPLAQSPSAPAATDRPSFEAASVKPNKSNEPRVALRGGLGGVINAINMTPQGLIQYAYRVQPFQVVGGPDWIRTDRFDVNAKAAGNVPPAQTQLMMQSLLADRFKLVAHGATTEAPIYALVMSKAGGKPGPELKVSDCPPPAPATAAGGAGRGGQNGANPCGTARIGPGNFVGQGVPVAQLLTFLSNQTGRPVVDRTGLTGTFDVDFKWAPDPNVGGPFGGLPPQAPGAGPAPPPPSDAAELFTALQEQLGLKLESTRGPVETIVIDRIEQPTPD